MGRIVGIDLGTTNSLVAYVDAQPASPVSFPARTGIDLCPSVVSLDPDGSVIVGEAARRRLLTAARTHHLFREAADGPRPGGRAERAARLSVSHRSRKART